MADSQPLLHHAKTDAPSRFNNVSSPTSSRNAGLMLDLDTSQSASTASQMSPMKSVRHSIELTWENLSNIYSKQEVKSRRHRRKAHTLNDTEKVALGHREGDVEKKIAASHCKRCGKDQVEHWQKSQGRPLCFECTQYMAAIKDDTPGSYVVIEDQLYVFSGPQDDGHSTMRNCGTPNSEWTVKRGDVIFVKDFAVDKKRGRRRGKIEYPFPGWVSLINTKDGYRKCCPFQEVTLLLHVERTNVVVAPTLSRSSSGKSELEKSESQDSGDRHRLRTKQLATLMDAGQFEEARALLEEIIAENEGNVELHNAVADSFKELKCGNSDEDMSLQFDYRGTAHGEILELRGLAVEEVRQNLRKVEQRLKKNNYSINLVNPSAQVSKAPIRVSGQSLSVWAVILIQFVLYMCVNTLQPALFQYIVVTFPEDAESTYSLALSFANMVKLGAPVVLGFISQNLDSRSAYLFTMLLGAAASYASSFSHSSLFVALGYGLLQEGPPAIRCVRYIYMARRCTSDDLGRLSQHATTVGLLGGSVGNLLAGLYSEAFGPERADEWPDAFGAGSMTNIGVFFVSLVLLWRFMDVSLISKSNEEVTALTCTNCCERPVPKNNKGGAPYEHCCTSCMRTPGCHSRKCNDRWKNWSQSKKREVRCDKCKEIAFEKGLCTKHLDEYALRRSFDQYKIFMTSLFCLVQAMLEFGVNAVVITTFQPIVVKTFGWGSSHIATVMLAGSILSFCVSQAVAMLAMKPLLQSSIAAGCYTASVFFFTWPPLSDWRIVIALILGLKAQILFSSPFSSLYAEKIGKERLTQNLSTAFQLAPGIGGMLGAASAPFFLPLAGQALFMLPALPVLASVGLLFYYRDHLGETNVKD